MIKRILFGAIACLVIGSSVASANTAAIQQQRAEQARKEAERVAKIQADTSAMMGLMLLSQATQLPENTRLTECRFLAKQINGQAHKYFSMNSKGDYLRYFPMSSYDPMFEAEMRNDVTIYAMGCGERLLPAKLRGIQIQIREVQAAEHAELSHTFEKIRREICTWGMNPSCREGWSVWTKAQNDSWQRVIGLYNQFPRLPEE